MQKLSTIQSSNSKMFSHMQYSLAFTTSIFLSSLTAASPILNQRQTVDCTDPRADLESSCWTTLHIPQYLTSWIKTTPTCGIHDNDRNCCKADEAWSTCFLRLAHGRPGGDCTQISSEKCSWDPSLASDLAPSIAPQVRYVLRNVYTINNLITSLYSGELSRS